MLAIQVELQGRDMIAPQLQLEPDNERKGRWCLCVCLCASVQVCECGVCKHVWMCVWICVMSVSVFVRSCVGPQSEAAELASVTLFTHPHLFQKYIIERVYLGKRRSVEFWISGFWCLVTSTLTAYLTVRTFSTPR